MTSRDAEYLEILRKRLRVCASYRPKLGHKTKRGYDLAGFQEIYRADPFYSWFGLDHPMMYAAHKAAGGMTSIYRQIGMGCEELFRRILQDQLDLSDADANWSYQVISASGRKRTLSLDGRIPLDKVPDRKKRSRIARWLKASAECLSVAPRISANLGGVVFEVRQGYKSKDSKRQNAGKAYSNGFLPCVLVLSTQMDEDIVARYGNENWLILLGTIHGTDPVSSTYAFTENILGYNLQAFFERHSRKLKAELLATLKKLLEPS